MFTFVLTIEAPDGSGRREIVVQNASGVDDASRTALNAYPGWNVVAWRHGTDADVAAADASAPEVQNGD